MPEIGVLPQKMADAKTVVLKTRLDPNVARLQAEGLKRNFFAKLIFLTKKPKKFNLLAMKNTTNATLLSVENTR